MWKTCHIAWWIANMRGEFRVKCPISAPQLQHFHSLPPPSVVQEFGVVEWLWAPTQDFLFCQLSTDTEDVLTLICSPNILAV
jgi:hypothetical protein